MAYVVKSVNEWKINKKKEPQKTILLLYLHTQVATKDVFWM